MTNHLMHSPAYFRKATRDEMVQCLTLLSVRPSRVEISSTISHAAYFIALDGVSGWSLQQAATRILQGSLRHPFFPEPSELRLACDAAMVPVHDARREEARRREMERQREDHRIPPRRTAEELERHAARMARLNESFMTEKDEALSIERADIRARYGMTEEVLAAIKDAPKAGTQIGKAARNVRI